ncbi:glycine rich domain-containing protein, partial [Methylobacterium sp. J-059]
MAQRTSNGRALHRAYVASTALVGISIRTTERPTVLHLAASAALLRERIGRLLTLAIETSASLLARLSSVVLKRVRRARPAAQIRRRRRLAMLTSAVAGLGAAPSVMVDTAAAQSMTYNYSGSTATYTTPFTGIFTITAYGAQGGSGSVAGGKGAQASGIFNLTGNEELTVAVGGVGTYKVFSGGGGGGSFIIAPNATPLVVAGGGGGAGYSASTGGGAGQATTDGEAGVSENGLTGGAAGTNG